MDSFVFTRKLVEISVIFTNHSKESRGDENIIGDNKIYGEIAVKLDSGKKA